MALLDDFKARFPEIDSAQADQLIPILEDVWPCYYGGKYEGCGKEIILNLLGHMLTIEASAGSGNVKGTQSESVGSVSISYTPGYAATSERMAWLQSTKYGMRYIILTRRRQGGVFV